MFDENVFDSDLEGGSGIRYQPLKEFLGQAGILIVDPVASSRARVAKFLVGEGARTSRILIVGDADAARWGFGSGERQVLVTAYALGACTGVELAEEFASRVPRAERVSILLASDPRLQAVFPGLEVHIDLCASKTFSPEEFRQGLLQVIKGKLEPNIYSVTLDEGLAQIAQRQYVEALELFNKAAYLHAKPTLALYYRAKALIETGEIAEAEATLKRGLRLNPVHYDLQLALFDILNRNSRWKEAYTVARSLLELYPGSSRLLSKSLTLAVITGSFTDLPRHYESFKELDVREEELVRHVCASLIVGGKHFLKRGETEAGRELLIHAAVSAAGRAGFLREIVAAFVEAERLDDAAATLNRFSPTMRTSDDFKVAEFLLYRCTEVDLVKVASHAMVLAQGGLKDPVLYYWLIRYLFEVGRAELAEEYLRAAREHWPGRKELFAVFEPQE